MGGPKPGQKLGKSHAERILATFSGLQAVACLFGVCDGRVPLGKQVFDGLLCL